MTVFVAVGDEDRIVDVWKESRRGLRRQSVPIEKHVQALRDLGFTEVVFPDEKRYELRKWPGIRRVPDVPDVPNVPDVIRVQERRVRDD